ncbi:MAG TPA: citramalate synthase [Spirochaetes bacterium]|nr:citramalate synthase [Spirochaetota bacterium]
MVKIYDTTLRDGSQGEGVTFTGTSKINVAKALDDFGIHYVEGGWPGSNPKDITFFNNIKRVRLKNAKIAAFGSTRRTNKKPDEDKNLRSIVKTEAPVATIFGKSWDLHVREVLRVTPQDNLNMIEDTIAYLKSEGMAVVYDAEHFFDGYKAKPSYALQTLATAQRGGAEIIVLADTNGGVLPHEIGPVFKEVQKRISVPLGIHAHNDSGLAVAVSIEAVNHGAVQVQGTINGYGERCGNADLCSIIPILILKMGIECIPEKNLQKLSVLSRYVSELANLSHARKMPFVGESAFAHKGGVHVDAVMKNPKSYEHVDPSLVGNDRRVLVSELSGKSNVYYKASKYGIDLGSLKDRSKNTKEILKKLKELEESGYQFEGAEGSFDILIKKLTNQFDDYFTLEGFRVITEKRGPRQDVLSEATIKVTVDDEKELTASEGVGPVNALDKALRKALTIFYPTLKEMKLVDYKVRILETNKATEAMVRVLIQSSDSTGMWGTVGVSQNIMEASWLALVDSISYKLMKDEKAGRKIKTANV